MEGIGVRVKAPTRTRSTKGYTDEEAAIVFAATLAPMSAQLPPDQRAARRWIPWLCCYTGARVGEIAQLRREDLHQEQGVWLLWITP
jgi:integrase